MNVLFNYLFKSKIKNYQQKAIETVLERSTHIIDNQTLNELKQKTLKFQNSDGGFCDRAGKSDLYYSLFGLWVSQALNKDFNSLGLISYIENKDIIENGKGVDLYCLSILLSKLSIKNMDFNLLEKKIKKYLQNSTLNDDYQLFLGILSLYYRKKYFSIYRILRNLKLSIDKENRPCPVVAAWTVISWISGKNKEQGEQNLMQYYRGDGSFSALKDSPVGDLLSTAVSLYALSFIGADLNTIKPDCFEYIDSLYDNGSFRATKLDFDTDIEYTFYGLLALGALA